MFMWVGYKTQRRRGFSEHGKHEINENIYAWKINATLTWNSWKLMFPHGVRHIIPHSSFVNSERRRGRRPKGTCAAWWVLRLASACWALAKNKANCLEGNTMSNRGAYSTKERMPSDIRQGLYSSAWKAVPDWWCTALQAVVGIGAISPAHPRFHSYVRGYE